MTVYHYKSNYEADQTADITNLPDVPAKRGIKTDIVLQIWIEPISGWLVKYQDNTLAYYYDRVTGEKISPWNKFTNTYTVNSVHQQVNNALKFKWKILTVDFIVPGLIILFAIIIVYIFYKRRFRNPVDKTNIFRLTTALEQKFRLSSIVLISVIILVVSLQVSYYFYLSHKKPVISIVGISKWSNNYENNEIIRGFKDGLAESQFIEGKNIKFIEENPNEVIEQQINIIQSFLDKKVDIIFTLNSPGTLIAKGIANTTPVVFANVTYPVELGLIHSLENSNNNFVGVRNYISPEYQFYYFEKLFPNTNVLGFIHHKGDPNSNIQYNEFKKILNNRNISTLDISAIDLADLRLQLEEIHNKVNALYLACDPFMQGEGGKVVSEFSNRYRIPSFSCTQENVSQGSLMTYTVNI